VIRASSAEPAAALASELRASLLQRHREAALGLISDAIGSWRAGGFDRHDDREPSCTVRVFAWMCEILDAHIAANPVQIIPIIEGVTPTREQLAGHVNVAQAKRPDLLLYLGGNHTVRMAVECKRFFRGANAGKYVDNGMARFLSGSYVTDAGRGAMVGFVMTNTVAARVEQVNKRIAEHKSLGAGDLLESCSGYPSVPDSYRSDHTAHAISLTHFFVDMSDVVRARQGLLKPVRLPKASNGLGS
jgi:hypothetical protein